MPLKKILSSFICLNFTQFFSALNDNVYKLLLAFFLIHLQGAANSNTILALAGAVFVIPFLLFASLAGTLADRYPKRNIILITRLAEVVIVSVGIIAFFVKSAALGYSILFLMATQSAIFSPCKYGIIPEIVKKEKVSRYNGFISATTYLAIIIGTFLASFLTDVTHQNFVLAGLACALIAVLGAIFSLGISKTPAQAKEKKVSPAFIAEIFRILKRANKTRYLLPAIIFNAYFLFYGAYTQLNMIPFVIQSLHLSAVEGGYLFLMTALGIGIGSFLAGKLSGEQVELGFPPLAAVGITFVTLGLFFFASQFYAVIVLLLFAGILGGFYIVPLDAFIQVASPPTNRGENVAAGNFLSFSGAIIASGLLALLGNVFGFSAAQGFLVIGCFTAVIAVLLILSMADQILRFVVSVFSRFFWNLKVQGKEEISLSPPSLLVAMRSSWVDTIVVMATLPRMIRYIVPIQGRFIKIRSFIYRCLWLVPIDIQHFSPIGKPALNEIEKELNLGHSVCLMQPVGIRAIDLNEWEQMLKQLLKDTHYSTIPIHVEHSSLPQEKSYYKQLRALWHFPIIVSYGEKK